MGLSCALLLLLPFHLHFYLRRHHLHLIMADLDILDHLRLVAPWTPRRFFCFSFSAEAVDWEALMERVLTRSYSHCLEDARRSTRPVPRLLMLMPTLTSNAAMMLTAIVVMGTSVICAVHATKISAAKI